MLMFWCEILEESVSSICDGKGYRKNRIKFFREFNIEHAKDKVSTRQSRETESEVWRAF